MSTKKSTRIEIDTDTIQAICSLCELAGMETPDVIKTDFIEKAQKRIKEILLNLKKQNETHTEETSKLKEESEKLEKKVKSLQDKLDKKPGSSETKDEDEDSTEETKEKKSKRTKKKDQSETSDKKTPRTRPTEINDILIIANLGVIMHQLKILFTKFGCNVSLVKNYTEAIGELKGQDYDCILFDMPSTHENDVMLLDALRKATEICETDTIIVALILPARDKAIPQMLKNKGADIVIEKNESWHVNILAELNLAS